MIAVPVPAPTVSLLHFPIASVVHRILVELPVFTEPGSGPASRAAAALASSRTINKGKGISHHVTVDPEAAGIIWQQVLAAEGDLSRGKSVRAALRDVTHRLNREIREAGYTYPTIATLPQPRAFVTIVAPGEERRNLSVLPTPKHWTGHDTDYAIIGGPGEPTRTQADMRAAAADLAERYLALYPLENGPVHQATLVIAASLIVFDRYQHPCTLSVSRAALRSYIELAEQARTS